MKILRFADEKRRVQISSLVAFKFACQCFAINNRNRGDFAFDYRRDYDVVMTDEIFTAARKPNSADALRLLPAVDALLKTSAAKVFAAEIGAKRLAALARVVVEELRAELRENSNGTHSTRNDLLSEAGARLEEKFDEEKRRRFQRVINATGVIIHTNLGRAPLADNAKRAVVETAAGYCTLEYDLATGKRGRRGRTAEDLLCELTGAESALVVNNCAAAAVLVLSALAAGGEGVVSRGELVEIGGDFRVPDVMRQSGVKLIEVGTTNRTKLKDYADAIGENTKMLIRVHPSNFRIVGFTAAPEVAELARLARERGILLYEDAGSGAIIDLSEFGLTDEPVISASIKAGADVVTFSGDKLLGGCQAGLIVGKGAALEKLRKHPLYRCLRVDKLIYAALAATLEIYVQEKHFDEIPVLRMLSQSKAEVARRAENFVEKFKAESPNFEAEALNFELSAGASAVGGGAAPLTAPPTILIALTHARLSAEELERALRFSNPPVISRIENDRAVLDLRTVGEPEETEIIAVLREISKTS